MFNWFSRIFKKPQTQPDASPSIPFKQVVNREAHKVSRQDISENALKTLKRLHKAGFDAFLVGGGVRDLLLGGHPKDFDVATNATPEEIQRLFNNCRLVGRRFRLAHICFGRDVIEVATFRATPSESQPGQPHTQVHKANQAGMLLRDNCFGTIEEDARRRDFTINALYYNIADFSIHAFCGGLEDLNQKVIRLIGDPETRYREDPVRMLRAARFKAKLSFEIDPATEAPISELAELLVSIPPARLFEEVRKLFLTGYGWRSYQQLINYGLFRYLFPATNALILQEKKQDQAEVDDSQAIYAKTLVQHALQNSDHRLARQKSVTPAFFYAAMLWPVFYQAFLAYRANMPWHPACQKAANHTLNQQNQVTAIPRRFIIQIREIWEMQFRLPFRSKRADQLLGHPKFRAAYDFILLREQSGEDLDGLGLWWTQYQAATQEQRQEMLHSIAPAHPKRGRRPKKRNRPQTQTIQVEQDQQTTEQQNQPGAPERQRKRRSYRRRRSQYRNKPADPSSSAQLGPEPSDN